MSLRYGSKYAAAGTISLWTFRAGRARPAQTFQPLPRSVSCRSRRLTCFRRVHVRYRYRTSPRPARSGSTSRRCRTCTSSPVAGSRSCSGCCCAPTVECSGMIGCCAAFDPLGGDRRSTYPSRARSAPDSAPLVAFGLRWSHPRSRCRRHSGRPRPALAARRGPVRGSLAAAAADRTRSPGT